ncbi:MAG: trypsin-like serine protease [Deltaproteobacteria bacterium]|nr:trypsin-like serine protease [Deltaproteobacteria bacterium]
MATAGRLWAAAPCLAAIALGAGACGETGGPDGSAPGRTRRAIVNGEPDTVHRAVVALVYYDAVFCSGTLIAPRAVLRAGHCLARGNRDPAQVQVFFGEDRAAGGQSVAVTEGFVHPAYYLNDARGAPMNDVAVLVLAADAPEAPIPWQQAPLPEMHGEGDPLPRHGWRLREKPTEEERAPSSAARGD